MTLGGYINKLRKGYNIYKEMLSQEELGAALNPPVKKATINNWERGIVKNIKKQYIQQMANIFGITPNELMCWDEHFDKLAYALKEYKTDEELISYLQSIDDETVKDILKGPSNMVREKIAKTFIDGIYINEGHVAYRRIQNKRKEAKPEPVYLLQKLEYALECKNENEMIRYLQSIDDEAVKDILKVHPYLVRGKLAITVMNWKYIGEENYISETFPNGPKLAEHVPETFKECKTAEELIRYLKSIDDEAVKDMLKMPSPDVVREVTDIVSCERFINYIKTSWMIRDKFVEKENYKEDELLELHEAAYFSFASSKPEERKFFETARGSEALRLAWLEATRVLKEAGLSRSDFHESYLDFIKVLEEDYSEKEV